MTQGERYARMCIKGWTSHHKAMMGGCGNYPWVRWKELLKGRTYYDWSRGKTIITYAGKEYVEQTRTIKVKGRNILERRLVKV